MHIEIQEEGPASPEPPHPEIRSLRTLRHRVALLLLTFSVVILPNLFSYAASLLGE